MQNQLRGKTNLLLLSMTRFEFFAHRPTMTGPIENQYRSGVWSIIVWPVFNARK
jgi:hypothetical protein